MRHGGTQILQTGRLTLRPFTLDDALMMYGNWANDPEVTRYLRWQPHRSWAETAEYLNEIAKHSDEPDFYQWAIELRASGILIGAIGIVRGEADPGWPEACARLGEAWEPGYCLGRKWWGCGYATEALCAVRDYWFGTVRGKWLVCCHANENPASGAVMMKAGFTYHHDATYHKYDGTPVPCRAYFLLRSQVELPDAKKDML